MRRGALAVVLAVALAAPAQAAPRPIAGGATFNTAATVEPGAFADSVVAGSQTVYRIALDPGQRVNAQVRLDVAAVDPVEAGALQVSAAVYGPLRDRLSEARAGGAADPVTHAKSVSVEGPRAGEQGNWYLVVSAPPIQGDETAPELPLSVTFATRTAASKPAREADDDDGIGWALAAGLAVIALVACGLGGAVAGRVLARRRSNAG
jgi:hypothetical protein